MKMKDLTAAFANYNETGFNRKINSDIEKLLQLRAVSKIISVVKSLHCDMVPKHLNENFKCTLESLHTFPQTWGIVYSVGREKGKLQIDDYDLEFLSRGMESIIDNKLLELASKGITVEHSFEEKLIYMLIGERLFNEYYQHALETEMNMI